MHEHFRYLIGSLANDIIGAIRYTIFDMVRYLYLRIDPSIGSIFTVRIGEIGNGGGIKRVSREVRKEEEKQSSILSFYI